MGKAGDGDFGIFHVKHDVKVAYCTYENLQLYSILKINFDNLSSPLAALPGTVIVDM